MYDVAVIGCGIIGAACAFELAKYRLSVVVIEKENDVANQTTKANSAIVHAGYDPTPGTLMAKLNVTGSKIMPELCKKLSVEYKRIGSLVLAFDDDDLVTLQKLYEQGIISRRELENAEKRLGAASSNSNPGPGVPAGPVITVAPIAGVVTDLAATADQAVQSGQRLLSLGSGETLAAVVPLEQQELYRVQPGTPVSVEVSGVTVKGEVAGIFPEVKDNALVSFLAHINLVNPPAGLLQPGLTVNVRIETGP